MLATSLTDADQVLSLGKPLKGGGPMCARAATYSGSGFLVDRTGLVVGGGFPPTFEFLLMRGDAWLFTFPPFCGEAGSDSSVLTGDSTGVGVTAIEDGALPSATSGEGKTGFLGGLPLVGIWASTKFRLNFAGLALDQ